MNKDLLKIGWNKLLDGSPMPSDVRHEVLRLLGDTLNLALPGTPSTPIAPLPSRGSRQRIALCLGHGRAGDEGAVSVDGTSEEDFNLGMIHQLAAVLMGWGYDVIIISYYEGNGYTAAMNWLAKTLVQKGATVAVEFHFNSSTGKARGHEFLHAENSIRGVTLAKFMLERFNQDFPEHPSRGLKKLSAADRGALFVTRTHCPAVIAEPFFGDNGEEWKTFGSEEGIRRLVTAYAHSIAAWVESQSA